MKKSEVNTYEKKVFYILIVCFFAAILIFNLLTPMIADDYSYGTQVRQAAGLGDLVRQEQYQYMTWTGRSVAHMLLRCFLTLPPAVFKVANSLAFMVLTLSMYVMVEGRKKYDWPVFLMIQAGLWLYAVDFRQTVLWETGACNYLWGAVFILFDMAVLHKMTSGFLHLKTTPKMPYLSAAGMLILGTAAGWCNENTSGGCLLYALACAVILLQRTRKVPPAVISNIIGLCAGLFMMVSAPGNKARAQFNEELHSGLYGLFARFQKITLHVQHYFFEMLAVLLFFCILYFLLQRYKTRREQLGGLSVAALYVFLFAATTYALILTAETQPRAFFGAGIFLTLAIVQLMVNCVNIEQENDISGGAVSAGDRQAAPMTARLASRTLLAVLCLRFVFTYLDCGANMVRLYRDAKEREDYIAEQAALGENDIVVGKVRPDFYNTYSAMKEMELDESPAFWTNVSMEEYFGVEKISAVEYEDWAVSVGRMTPEEAQTAREVRAASED